METQNRKGVVLAAPKSGSGKTLITCALIQSLLNRQESVFSYKCGPDYIDPMFHRTILGVSGGNLDTFFTGEQKTRELFLSNTPENSFTIVEGVMGLFDGLGGVKEEGSTYHLAKTISIPIILVVDAHGMGRSILPLIAGFLSYDTAHQIKGVILNRVSKMFYGSLKEMIEKELELEVLGYFPERKELQLESRHLGLKMPEEKKDLKEQVQRAANQFEESVNLNRILEIGAEAVTSSIVVNKNQIAADKIKTTNIADILSQNGESLKENKVNDKVERPVLAVARDEAFCFYYQENLKLLEQAGFLIREFSPIHDDKLPEGTSAILLGGGYPELFAKELSDNQKMKSEIREAINSGMPSVAECGGFMYLHESLTDAEEKTYPMVSVIKEHCNDQGKLVRFGYVELQENESMFLPKGTKIRGHEFHYFDSTNNGVSCVAKKPVGKRQWDCVWEEEKHWWGFPHLYYPSNPSFVEHFYEEAIKCQFRQQNQK